MFALAVCCLCHSYIPLLEHTLIGNKMCHKLVNNSANSLLFLGIRNLYILVPS